MPGGGPSGKGPLVRAVRAKQPDLKKVRGTSGFVDHRLDVEWQVGVESRIDWVGL